MVKKKVSVLEFWGLIFTKSYDEFMIIN